MKLLLVEDEAKTRAYLRKGFAENGFVVDLADNGRDGLRLALTGIHDLIILDVLLPHCDGWSVLEHLREKDRHTPVLFLTARDSVPDRVKGLELGADDYLVKPFAFSELLARIHCLLRRGTATHEDVVHIGGLELDLPRLRVTRNGRRIHLTPKEFGLLALLVQHAGETLSRTFIAEQVWNMNFDSATNVVDVAIRRLRSKIDDSYDSKLIHSVRGMGYVLDDA
jgi:two-component system copper resistance phosphate regulon response regulator CusR